MLLYCTHSLGLSGSSPNSPFGFPRCFRNAVSNISLASYLGDHNSTFKVSALLFFFHAYFHITVLDSVGFNITDHYHDSSPPDAVFSSSPAPAHGRGKRGVDLYLSRIPATFPDDVTSWKWRLSIVGCAATTGEREVSSAAGVRCFWRSAVWQHGELHDILFIIGHRVCLYKQQCLLRHWDWTTLECQVFPFFSR